MATNITVFDLENYPDNNKTVTVDVTKVTPVGSEGDEKWVMSFVTSAFSNNTNSTAIQDIYVQEIKTGWLKSSGLVGTGNNFDITASNKTLGIKIDATSGYYYIVLEEGVNIGGDTVAADMETKIRAVPDSGLWSSSDDELAYKNCSVEYTDGKFYIISGTVSPFYTGANRSSVKVTLSGSDTAHADLGFNLSIDSQSIASTAILESLVTSNYTADTSPVAISTLSAIGAGDAVAITDGTNTDYFTALSGTTSTSIVVATSVSGLGDYTGIANSYTASEAKIQILKLQDPDQSPAAIYDEVDEAMRWGIKSIVNQIDFSS